MMYFLEIRTIFMTTLHLILLVFESSIAENNRATSTVISRLCVVFFVSNLEIHHSDNWVLNNHQDETGTYFFGSCNSDFCLLFLY